MFCVWMSAISPANAHGVQYWLKSKRMEKQLGSSDSSRRIEAVRFFSKYGAPKAAGLYLAESLRGEEDPEVRREIIRALARRGDHAAEDVLLESLKREMTVDRVWVYDALAAIGTKRSIRVLVNALERDALAARVLDVIDRVGDQATPHLVNKLVGSRSPAWLIRALALIGEKESMRSVVPFLNSDDLDTRLAAIEAVGDLGTKRYANKLIEHLHDPDPAVSEAALQSLHKLGSKLRKSTLVPLLRDTEATQKLLALRIYLRFYLRDALPVLRSFLRSSDPVIRGGAIEIAQSLEDPVAISTLVNEAAREPRLITTLANIRKGAGLNTLLKFHAQHPSLRPTVEREVAILLRRWREDLDDDEWENAVALLRNADPSPRTLLLRALAQDPSVDDELLTILEHPIPLIRATAARAFAFLGDAEHLNELAEALQTESNPETVRRLCEAIARLEGKVALGILWRHINEPESAPEALALAALSADEASVRERRRLAVLMRQSLRAYDARTRAGAARALAIMKEKSAWRALLVSLEDNDEQVRLASAHAMLTLATMETIPELRAQWRVENASRIRNVLRSAIAAAKAKQAPESSTNQRIFRILIKRREARKYRSLLVDLKLDDGRWHRSRTLPTGELIVTGMPGKVADLQIQVGH